MFRMQEETGASVSEIADAYAIVHGIFIEDAESIEQLDNVIPAQPLKMLDEARRIMRRASRWYIRHGNKTQSNKKLLRATVVLLICYRRTCKTTWLKAKPPA